MKYPATHLTPFLPTFRRKIVRKTIASAKNPARAPAIPLSTFRMNTCKSVSKQRTLTPSRMNTYAKPRGRGPLLFRLRELRVSAFGQGSPHLAVAAFTVNFQLSISSFARKSFIYRFYAECASKSFIYRIYAFAPGCGGSGSYFQLSTVDCGPLQSTPRSDRLSAERRHALR